MALLDELDDLTKKLRGASGAAYLQLAEEAARQIAGYPHEHSAAIREWVANLYHQFQQQEELLLVLDPSVQGLAGRGDSEAAELLGTIMLDENTGMTEDIAEWLGEMGAKAQSAVPQLIELLSSSAESDAREKAAVALSDIGGPVAVAALRDALHDEEGGVRFAALTGLLALDEVIPYEWLMEAARSDPDYLVRAAAIRGLKRLYREQSAAELHRMSASETNPTVLKALARDSGAG